MTDPRAAPEDLAARALAHYDLGEHTLVPLAESFNTVFRVDTRTARFVLRIGPAHRVHPVGAAGLEARWTGELAARGLPVPRVVTARDGSASVQVEADGPDGSRECTVLTWQPGRPPTRPLSAVDVRDLATLCAQLHEASPPLAERPTGSPNARSVVYFDVADLLDELPGVYRPVVVAARDRARAVVDDLWRSADTAPRLIHGDLTPTNVVRHNGVLSPIDFQDLSWAHVEQDLAHSIYGATRGVGLHDGLHAFRTAYEQVRPWPALDLALLTDLVTARRVAMVNLALLRRRDDLEAYAARHAEALHGYAPDNPFARPDSMPS